MIYELKDYQRIAVDKLKRRLIMSLEEKSKASYVFKSPTGSGKTFMASSLFEELSEEKSELNFCVMWACPGKGELHKQSYNAVKKYLGGNPKCSLLEDDFFGYRKYIKNKEIVFINWEKLVTKDKETGKWANNLMKDQEGINFIDVIENTKKNGTIIILVIDESHIGSSQKTRIQEFINTIIIPNITLEMSATPLSDIVTVEVDPQDVIDEGMIRKDVIVNEGISKEDRNLEDKDSEILVLEKGYEKRLELKNRYASKGINVNPLMLIQIPNKDEGEAKKLVILDFLREKGITYDNGKLKFWCDGAESFDKKQVRENNDITEFLVFKTAVATGWDCPRAQILVKFREGKSETFEIQTIGRILRTSEAKSYEDELLDNAYIFTNIKEFETKHDTYNPNRIKTEFSKMRAPYSKDIVWLSTQLISFYRSRQGDYNSADSNYSKFFLKSFMNLFELKEEDKNALMFSLKDKLEAKGLILDSNANDELLEETHMDVSSIDQDKSVSSESAIVRMSENDLQAQYYSLIRSNLSGLAYVRSKSPVNTAIVDCLSTFYNVFQRNNKVHEYQKIVVNNKEIFAQILSESTKEFRDSLAATAGKKGVFYDFKIEPVRAYSLETHVELPSLKSLYQPLFVLKDDNDNPENGLEKDFIKYLDKATEVEWFWENGTELMQVNFGIPYNNGMNTFQPDFIVKFKDGTVGIFDTKPINYRVEDTTVKAEALIKYISTYSKNRGGLGPIRGGMVVKSGTQFYVSIGNEYRDYSIDKSKWRNFNDLLRDINFEMQKNQ